MKIHGGWGRLDKRGARSLGKRRSIAVIAAFGAVFAIGAVSSSSASATVPTYYASTLAGNNNSPGATVAGPALNARFAGPEGAAVDAAGNVYVADRTNNVVAKIDTSGNLTIIAGTGTAGAPIPGPATSSPLNSPSDVAIDQAGNLYIADYTNHEVEKIDTSGNLSVFAGNGGYANAVPGPATSSPMVSPRGLAIDSSGNVYIADANAYQIYKVTPSGTLSIFAGTGATGAPVAGPALSSPIFGPFHMDTDSAGNLYVPLYFSNQIVKITPSGTLSVVAGTGTLGNPTNGPALSSNLNRPQAVKISASGDIYIADRNANSVDVVSGGQISTVAGGPAASVPPPATALSAYLGQTYGLAINTTSGVIYVAASSSVVTLGPPPVAPSVVGSVTATPGNNSANLSFSAPYNGGSVITAYQYSLNGGSTWNTLTTTGSTSISATITGLTNGTAYTVQIRALNTVGAGAVSTVTVTPVASSGSGGSGSGSSGGSSGSVPGAPTNVVGSAAVSHTTVSWTAPSPATGVTGYTATATPGGATCSTTSVSATSCVVGGVAGTSYTYSVVAHSAAGDSPVSTVSTPVTPTSPPVPTTAPLSAPTTLTTTDGPITTADPGQQVTVVGTGFLPNSTVSIVAFSSPVVLGTAVTNSAGSFSQAVTVPSTLAAGSHNLVASGVDPTGATHTIRLAFTVGTALATTGVNAGPIALIAIVLLLLGASVVIVTRRLAVRKK